MFDTARKYLWIFKAIAKLTPSTQKKVVSKFLTAQKKYLPEKSKADVADILKCALCPNMCRFDCPVLQAAKSETYSPSGKARIAYLIEMERLLSDDAVNLMYACAGCSACQEWCPFKFSVEDLLIGVRKDAAKKGMIPRFVMDFKRNLVENHTVYERGSTSMGIESRKADILYFAGCTTLNRTREIGEATLRIIEKAGIAAAILPEEWCCGAPLSILGFDKDFKEFAEHNRSVIREGGYRTVVCSCPECVYTFRDVYPRIGLPLKIEVLHTSEFLLKLVKEGELTFRKCEEEYIYHDPCVLSRKLNIYVEPRELLKRSGVSVKEAQFNRKETRCCGMGGMITLSHPDISLEMIKSRNSELTRVCKSIVTACPTCKVAFKKVNDLTLDVSEVVLKLLE